MKDDFASLKKMKRNVIMEKESTSCLNKMMILTFSYSILLRSMSTRRLMKDSCLDIKEVISVEKSSLALSPIEILNWV